MGEQPDQPTKLLWNKAIVNQSKQLHNVLTQILIKWLEKWQWLQGIRTDLLKSPVQLETTCAIGQQI